MLKNFIRVFIFCSFLASGLSCRKHDNDRSELTTYDLKPEHKQFINDLVSDSKGKLSGITVCSADRILHSSFYDGRTINDKYYVQSISKSIISIIAYIAIEEGYFKYKQPIADFFPDYSFQIKNTAFEHVTIADLMNMRTGIIWNEDARPEVTNPTYLMGKLNDPLKYIFSQKIKDTPGEFNYCSANVFILCEIIERCIGHSLHEYISEKIFFPLKMYGAGFEKLSNGRYNYWGGMILSAKSLVLFSQAILKGSVNADHVIPEAWINKTADICSASSLITGYFDVNYYSDLWYGTLLNRPNAGALKILSANGFGNNHILIIPELRLSILISGNSDPDQPEAFFNYIQFVRKLTE